MNYSNDDLMLLRSIEQEILDVVVEFCDTNNLKYSLGYGTLIGAIRHKGFIPWDDDIDLIMPREDYEFLRIHWNNSLYYLQDYYNDLNFPNNFIKIRKNHTTFFADHIHENKNMSGIFIDIFPADRVPNNLFSQKIQYFACAFNLLFTRGYPSGHKGIIKFFEEKLLKLPRNFQILIRNKSEMLKRHWNSIESGQYVNSSTIIESKIFYPSYMFDNFVELTFNGKKYKSVSIYNEFLTIMYGDYMKLPPLNERVWGHQPKILNFTKNFNELSEDNHVLS